MIRNRTADRSRVVPGVPCVSRLRHALSLLSLVAAGGLLAGCVHGSGGARTSGPAFSFEESSDGTSKVVSALAGALHARDRAKIESLCPASFTIRPASVEAAPAFVSPTKLRVERYHAQGADADAAPLTGDAARAYLLEQRERFAGIIRNESHIRGVERRGEACLVHVHVSLAGVDSTHARIQEESWWTWTLARSTSVPEGWTLTQAVEDRRTLVTAPGPIYRQVYPDEEDDTAKPWKPGTALTPRFTTAAFPGDVDTGGVAVLDDCVDRGPCVLVAGGTGLAALSQGSPTAGGPFVDRAAMLSLAEGHGEAQGILSSDFNNDGMPDLLVTYQDAPCRLYQGRRYLEDVREEGDTTRVEHLGFEDITESAGLSGLKGSFRTAIGLDADRDGWLDLYLVQYGDPSKGGPSASGKNGAPNVFMRNLTKAGEPMHFVDDSRASGTADTGWGLSAAATDYDGDGRPDIYVANAFGPSVLYRNVTPVQGAVRFESATRAAGVESGMLAAGVAWGDYDGDGAPDLFVSGHGLDETWVFSDARFPAPGAQRKRLGEMSRGGMLFKNDREGSGRFTKSPGAADVADTGWGWGAVWTDVDGDGRLDLVVANGLLSGPATESGDVEVSTQSRELAMWADVAAGRPLAGDPLAQGITGPQPERLFLNLGDGSFADVGWAAGFDTSADLRGLAAADLTGDGAPELVGATYLGPPVIFENTNMSNVPHVRVRLEGTASNWDGVGAVVRLTAGGRTQVREVTAGGSFLSDSGRILDFGLGAADSIDAIDVAWPSGRTSHVGHPQPNRRGIISITEPPPGDAAAPSSDGQ